MQHAKKVLASDSMGQGDFANRQVIFWGGIHVKESIVINPAYQEAKKEGLLG